MFVKAYIFIFFSLLFAVENVRTEKSILFDRDAYADEQQEARQRAYEISISICPNHTTEVEEKLTEFQRCTKSIDENQKNMCQVIEETLRSCTPPITRLYESCLPSEVKSLPAFIFQLFINEQHLICNTDGAHILELFNPCMWNKKHYQTQKCMRKLKNEVAKYNPQNLPAKNQLCMFINTFKDCFVNHVHNSCKDNVTREIFLQIYEAIPCQ